MEMLVGYCKEKGFVFQSSDIYGGLGGFFDYGHLGTQLKRNILSEYWKYFVLKRENIIGQDSSIISNPTVWKASGHLDNFDDPIIITSPSKLTARADHFIEEKLKICVDGLSCDKLLEIIKENNLKYEGETVDTVTKKNLMFSTITGTSDSTQQTVYLRPETCQAIFCNARLLANINRLSLPFGIAQVGKAFRNEISPKNFIFRCREFEQIEMEFFHNPSVPCESITDKHTNFEIGCLFANNISENIRLGTLLDKKLLSDYHLYWVAEMLIFLTEIIGINKTNLRIREHNKEELSHYSSATFDIDFLYPFGEQPSYKELCGIANRSNYDITQHATFSKKNLFFHDDQTKEKLYPHVIEPSIGLDRLFLAVLANGYEYDKERDYIVMHFTPKLCPNEYAVFPLPSKKYPKEDFINKSRQIFEKLIDQGVSTVYDRTGSIGRRYARQDEIGTKWCLTIDEQTLEDNTITIRDRDTKEQKRISISELYLTF
jgi:glycyl-tRNA synthetase